MCLATDLVIEQSRSNGRITKALVNKYESISTCDK